MLVARGRADEAVALLSGFLEKHPEVEGTYVTLAKVYLGTDRRQEGLAVLERLLQRNPTHEQGRAILQQIQLGVAPPSSSFLKRIHRRGAERTQRTIAEDGGSQSRERNPFSASSRVLCASAPLR